MAEESSAQPLAAHPSIGDTSEQNGNSTDSNTDVSISKLKLSVEDDVYVALKRHFLMQGKGRRPDPPSIHLLTNGLLLQLYFLREEADATYGEVKAWLNKLLPASIMKDVTESQICHRVNALLNQFCASPEGDATAMLTDECSFQADLPVPLSSLGITQINIDQPDLYDNAPQRDITNEVVVLLSHLLLKRKQPPISLRKWLVRLSIECKEISESKLRTLISNTLSKYKNLSKNKKTKGSELEAFLRSPFVLELNKQDKRDSAVTSNDKQTVICRTCEINNSIISQLKGQLSILKEEHLKNVNLKNKLEAEITLKDNVIEDLQKDKNELSLELLSLKTKMKDLTPLKKTVKTLEKKLDDNNTKLCYQRNVELKAEKEDLERKVGVLEEKVKKEQNANVNMKKQIKQEQDLKHNYKKKAKLLADQNKACLHFLNTEKKDESVTLKQQVEKCTMYADNVRLLYMTLQGEANVAASQASKVVMLVAKYLFDKDIPLHSLPCPRTCLNFMYEANHIAKQHIVNEIRKANHFTYATDGTGREKRHYIEHHIVLDSGSTLSVGFSEVADDKADTLLEKTLDLFEELTDVYCQAEETVQRQTVFTEVLTKLKALMSDRAANMKLFNRKMLDYKKDLLGNDTVIHFLYCNAHFLIGLADAADKEIRKQESQIEESSGKLGRGSHETFKHWNADETSASRLIRTASDVFGPRGDEKSGCREEWLAFCDTFTIKSTYTSYRTNRFNNLFENSVALLFHHTHSLQFLEDFVSHFNRKLESISYDLQDKRLMSIITALGLLSTYLTTPYWALMNSSTPYGQFNAHVRSMKTALERWSSSDFELCQLRMEEPVFGKAFFISSDVSLTFLSSHLCDEALCTNVFKAICEQFIVVIDRQLNDFLPGGVYGDVLPSDIQELLDTCPLTNLTGERLFGDLDYDMSKRRSASTYLRSTINIWKHNTPSKFLESKSPDCLKQTIYAGRKYGKGIKRKRDASVKAVREKTKARTMENERKKGKKKTKTKKGNLIF